jgi:hypothetical protein
MLSMCVTISANRESTMKQSSISDECLAIQAKSPWCWRSSFLSAMVARSFVLRADDRVASMYKCLTSMAVGHQSAY